MHIPKTYLSLHDVTGLTASVGVSHEQPLVLTIDGTEGSMQITLFLQPLLTSDQISTLAAAIRSAMVMAEPGAIPACPAETAAYKAADDYWERLSIDLNRHPIEKAAE
jgi:hypothetical protein